MLAKLMSVMDNNIQPLHETVEALRRSYAVDRYSPTVGLSAAVDPSSHSNQAV